MNKLSLLICFSAVLASESSLVWKEGFNEQNVGSNAFTFATKNVLANEWTWPEYFKHADEHCLSWNHRFSTHMEEFSGYNADILALQEVDRFNPELTGDVFQNDRSHVGLNGFWESGLQGLGYSSHFRAQHPRNVGVMMAHKIGRWKELSSGGFSLAVATQHMPSLRPYQMTFSVLEDREQPGRGLISATTHLYFAGAPIRGHQVILLLRCLSDLRKTYPDFPVILAGDFNMFQKDASRKLILGSPELQTDAFWEEAKKPEVRGQNTIHPNPAFDWEAARADFQPDGVLSGMAAVDLFEECGFPTTNHTPTFSHVLDYIFMIPAVNGQTLELVAYKPLPTGDDLKHIPNEQEASDHFALFGYLQFAS